MRQRDRFAGMDYEQASREAMRLVNLTAEAQNWFSLADDLQELKLIAERAAPT